MRTMYILRTDDRPTDFAFWKNWMAISRQRSCVRPIDWYQNQRPWMTLNGHFALCFKMHAFLESTTKIWMQRYCQQQRWAQWGDCSCWLHFNRPTVKNLSMFPSSDSHTRPLMFSPAMSTPCQTGLSLSSPAMSSPAISASPSSVTVVSGCVRFMGIFVGFLGDKPSNNSGVILNVDFQCFQMLRLWHLRKWGQHYYTVLFSPLLPFHWPQNTWPWMAILC